MRHRILTLLAGTMLVGLAGPASAQDTPPPPPGPAHMAPPTTRAEALARAEAMFDRLDLNHDGRLTQQEAQQARAARRGQMEQGRDQRRAQAFDRLDGNHDGQISRQEFDARQQMAGRGPGRRGPRGPGAMGGPGGRGAMAARLFGADGVITREAFRDMAGQRFDRLDANHDGNVSPEERREARGRMRAMMPPPPPPPAPAN